MLWGLWMDAERIGPNSAVAREHPEWLAHAATGGEIGGLLDLTNPAAAAWMEAQIGRVIEDYGLEFFRLDFNTHGIPRQRRAGFVGKRLLELLRGRITQSTTACARVSPIVVFEACAGGGGRTDIGLVRRFSHTWVTDWQIAPRSFAITNGMTMALPPEYVDRLIGGQTGYLTGDFDFQTRLLMFVRPTIGFPKPMGAEWNPHMLARLRHYVDLYKRLVRPIMPTGRIYHHTPAVTRQQPQGWGVLELASRERDRGICGIFQLAGPTEREYQLRLRGLDAGRRYRVTFDNSGQTCELDGVVLMQQGITIRLEGALTSELVICEAMV